MPKREDWMEWLREFPDGPQRREILNLQSEIEGLFPEKATSLADAQHRYDELWSRRSRQDVLFGQMIADKRIAASEGAKRRSDHRLAVAAIVIAAVSLASDITQILRNNQSESAPVVQNEQPNR